MSINLQNESGYPVDVGRIAAAAACVLTRQRPDAACDLSIVLTDNAAVAALNQQFRGIAAATDVLSFPAELPDMLADDALYLGDLVIAYPYAKDQAAHEGHDIGDSLCLLVIHGTLHLLGFDHDTPHNKAKMWAEQAACLEAIGISTAIVPALEGAADDH